MCGRFALSAKTKDIEKLISNLNFDSELLPRFNIAPTQNIASVLMESPEELAFPKWGLVPFWSKDVKIGSKLINARAETIAEKPSFRDSFKKRRCLIFASGFYEWKKSSVKKSSEPYFIKLVNSSVFAFAGIYDRWGNRSEPLITASIITTEANDKMSDIHSRMPVIIYPDDFDVWLAPNADAQKHLLGLLKPYPNGEMELYPVSTAVNNPSINTPECCQPL